MGNTVIITGVRGMDGSTLAEKYLERGWKVVGIDIWEPTSSYPNLVECIKNANFIFETGDITEYEWIEQIMGKYQPDIVYNLGAISLVPESFKLPKKYLETNTLPVIHFLELIRYRYPKTRFYQASSSEQIGKETDRYQNTDSKMTPASPYGISKLAAYHFVRLYRDSYGIFASNGMLWNHEGPRRGLKFVTRKITNHVAKYVYGERSHLVMGNLDSGRDWGLSSDYCDAMIKIMEADKSDDYAVATGETHTVREFIEEAYACIGIPIIWRGTGVEEKGYHANTEEILVEVNAELYRPMEVPYLHGDPSKIKNILGWTPKTTFKELVKIMVRHDLDIASKGVLKVTK